MRVPEKCGEIILDKANVGHGGSCVAMQDIEIWSMFISLILAPDY